MTPLDDRERRRLALQAQLDGQKSSAERNKLGQFATPTALARDIAAHGRAMLGSRKKIRFLDPALGTGAFYSALRAAAPPSRLGRCLGFDIDPHYAEPAIELWRDTPLELTIGDFTRADPPQRPGDLANLILCNPPYVRHHHLAAERKRQLQRLVHHRLGIRPSGLAGLYCYFLWLAHPWLAPGGAAGWLIPSEWMDVNYGAVVKEYLLTRVELTRIHRFAPSDAQFGDALVSSTIVWFRKLPATDQPVELSFGGTLAAPDKRVSVSRNALRSGRKWTRLLSSSPAAAPATRDEGSLATLGDVFTIKRGIATGANSFFVLCGEQARDNGIPKRFLRPILPSPRYLDTDEIDADQDGIPLIGRRRYLLTVELPEHIVRAEHPRVFAYLQRGLAAGIHQRYLSRHRSPWYAQERRSPAPILCTYMGRVTRTSDRPFRFILNRSAAIAANVYLLLYPRPALARAAQGQPQLLRDIWSALQRLPIDVLVAEGRVYGGGLYKLEPKELAHLPLSQLGVSQALAKSIAHES